MKKLVIISVVFLIILGAGVYMMFQDGRLRNSNRTQTSNQNQQLANPASVNCEKLGGTLSIETRGDGGEFGLCTFDDDQACEEWALFRGECPVGGVKTTGFDNIEQKYCAWVGGQTLAVENAECTLPSGETCSVHSLYNGTCTSNTIQDPNSGS